MHTRIGLSRFAIENHQVLSIGCLAGIVAQRRLAGLGFLSPLVLASVAVGAHMHAVGRRPGLLYSDRRPSY